MGNLSIQAGNARAVPAIFTVSLVLGCGRQRSVVKEVEQRPTKSTGVIAFHSDRSGIDQVYAVNPDGTDLRVLTDKSGRAMFPKWSYDGTRLAYAIDREDGTRISYLDLGNPNTPLLWVVFTFKDTAFSWSPVALPLHTMAH